MKIKANKYRTSRHCYVTSGDDSDVDTDAVTVATSASSLQYETDNKTS